MPSFTFGNSSSTAAASRCAANERSTWIASDPSASESKAARPDRSVRANRRRIPFRLPSGWQVRWRADARDERFLGEPGRNLMRDLRRSRAKRNFANRAVRHRDVNSFHGNCYANRWLRNTVKQGVLLWASPSRWTSRGFTRKI